MRKALIILFTGIHLFGNTEFGQILRWPEFFSHYFQHSSLNPEISFFEFISMHYGGNDGTNADNDIDNKLPCRDINHNSLSIAFSPMVKALVVEEQYKAILKNKEHIILNPVSSGFKFKILQPPRCC